MDIKFYVKMLFQMDIEFYVKMLFYFMFLRHNDLKEQSHQNDGMLLFHKKLKLLMANCNHVICTDPNLKS